MKHQPTRTQQTEQEIAEWFKCCVESKLGIVLPMPKPIQRLHDELERLKAENARLTNEHRKTYELLMCKVRDKEAENARLAAALAMCKLIAETHKPHPVGCDCMQCVPLERVQAHASEPGNALRDLLAPTIGLLSRIPDPNDVGPFNFEVQRELARLRGIVEGNA